MYLCLVHKCLELQYPLDGCFFNEYEATFWRSLLISFILKSIFSGIRAPRPACFLVRLLGIPFPILLTLRQCPSVTMKCCSGRQHKDRSCLIIQSATLFIWRLGTINIQSYYLKMCIGGWKPKAWLWPKAAHATMQRLRGDSSGRGLCRAHRVPRKARDVRLQTVMAIL